MHGDYATIRINLGSSELVSINQLVDIVEDIAGIKLKRRYNLDAPERRERPQQRQHAHPKNFWLGTVHPAARRPGAHLCMDLRSNGATGRQAIGDAISSLVFRKIFSLDKLMANCAISPSWYPITDIQ